MGKHTLCSVGVCIIFFYGLFVIGEIHAQMAGNCRIVILLGSQQHLFYLIGDHRLRLILQFLHGIGNTRGAVIIPACKQQVGICIHDRNIRRSVISQPGSHTFCQCCRIGGSKGSVQFQLNERRSLFLLCCQRSVILWKAQMHFSGFYSTLCLYGLGDVFFQIGIVKSLLVSSSRRHTVAQIIAQFQFIRHVSRRSKCQICRTLFAALYIDLQSIIGFSVSDPRAIQSGYDL